jgi:hypothetical protein
MNDADSPKIDNGVSDSAFIESLVSDREKFDDYVYFATMEEAMAELERRRNDPELMKKVEEYFKDIGIPEPLRDEPKLVLFRQLATPNIEVSRFMIIADGTGISPLFLEYYDDKFTSNNEWKWYLGKLAFYEGVNKLGGGIISYKLAIDFVNADGKKIRDVKTLWGESLIDFHHRLFFTNYPNVGPNIFFDGTEWFKHRGLSAAIYYEQVLSLFICNGILFDNFMLSDSELNFTSSTFLPSFIKIYKHFNVKPIIVALEPTVIESSEFWLCQNPVTKKKINEIIQSYDGIN